MKARGGNTVAVNVNAVGRRASGTKLRLAANKWAGRGQSDKGDKEGTSDLHIGDGSFEAKRRVFLNSVRSG